MYRRILSSPVRVLVLLCLAFAVAWAAEDYSIKKGETLGALATRWYGDFKYWTELAAYNGISNPYTIPEGTNIKRPDKAALDQIRAAPAGPERARQIAEAGGTARPAPKVNEGSGFAVEYDAVSALGHKRQR